MPDHNDSRTPSEFFQFKKDGCLPLVIGLLAFPATLFFGFWAALLVYMAFNFEEGAFDPVHLYISASVFVLLTLLCGGITWLGLRAARRRLKRAEAGDALQQDRP